MNPICAKSSDIMKAFGFLISGWKFWWFFCLFIRWYWDWLYIVPHEVSCTMPSNMDGFHLYYGPVFTNNLSANKKAKSGKAAELHRHFLRYLFLNNQYFHYILIRFGRLKFVQSPFMIAPFEKMVKPSFLTPCCIWICPNRHKRGFISFILVKSSAEP